MAKTASPSSDLAHSAHADLISAARAEIGKVIFGQNQVVDQTLISLISGGHVLLIGVPGLAKTLLVETIASVLGLTSNRIQCTPDLMPADIVGSEVLEEDHFNIMADIIAQRKEVSQIRLTC